MRGLEMNEEALKEEERFRLFQFHHQNLNKSIYDHGASSILLALSLRNSCLPHHQRRSGPLISRQHYLFVVWRQFVRQR